MALVGFMWSVASVFAIPVIVREHRQDNPVVPSGYDPELMEHAWRMKKRN